MIDVHATAIPGVYRLQSRRVQDGRGWLDRISSTHALTGHGLACNWQEISTVWNDHPGGLRGLHYQRAPFTEAKLIRCLFGEIFDVALDIRRDSPCFGQHVTHRLQAGDMLYLAPGIAHGVQCISEKYELLYLIDQPYSADHACGILWSDPDLAIDWPVRPPAPLSERDRNWPGLAATDPALLC